MRGYDKWEAYFSVYDNVMKQIKPGANYLEIGIQNMGWPSELDEEGKFERVVGCDLNPKVREFAHGTRFTDVFIGDSTSFNVHKQISDLGLEFDLVVDDASHTQHDILVNFMRYFPMVAEGGFYIIEDTHTDFSSAFADSNYFDISIYEFFGSLASLPTLETVNRNLVVQNRAYALVRAFNSDTITKQILSRIKGVSFTNSCIMISKGDPGIGSRFVNGSEWPVVSLEQLNQFSLKILQDMSPPPEPQLAVVYLNRVTNSNEQTGRDAFLAAYRKFPPKVPHQLYVINKGFLEEDLHIQYRLFAGLGARFFYVSDVGYDLTAYSKVVTEINEPVIFFMNTYSEPLHANWLDEVFQIFQDPEIGLAGCSGSIETHHPFRPGFEAFPNYHIRTTSFMLDTQMFIDCVADSEFLTKDAAYQFECGSESLTRRIEATGKRAVVVGRKGQVAREALWRASVFRSGRQRNLLVADNQTVAYASASPWKKFLLWGTTWFGLMRLKPSVLKWNYQHGGLPAIFASLKINFPK